MKSWFLKRGYPKSLVEQQISKISSADNQNISRGNAKGVPLVLTYNPLLKSADYILKKYLDILYLDEEVKKVFSPGPMVSYRSPRKLRSYLVRAKVHPVKREKASRMCKKSKCHVCFNVKETDTFSCNRTGKNYKINHHLTCDDKCLIYLLNCNKCNLQYVGQTTESFRYRWNNYKCNYRKYLEGETCMQKHIFQHFNSEGHTGFLEDVSVSFIDKTDPRKPLEREQFWIRTLNTMTPNVLNVEYSV